MEDDDGPLAKPVKMENGEDHKANGNNTNATKMDLSLSSPDESARGSGSSRSLSEETKNVTSTNVSPEDVDSRPNLSRKASKKEMESRPPPLFNDLPDMTEEACRTFATLRDCIYAHRSLGNSDQEFLECECEEEWRDGTNHACGEDSDCINRVTRIECVESNCGKECQNRRFQDRLFAQVSVIKTEKKGYGLRADTDLEANDFIYEYIGEVIGEALFEKRMVKYDDEKLEHFYFMSLTRTEYVDATKKGNLGRFCNHSCQPNCYVDKWVVKDKLRMGIFALRRIRAGEELCFNYNVDRYGANPQQCHCGEPNCTGILGGKTQTERATKLPLAMLEALGIDDGGDHWDTGFATKKPRKKRATETDEEYVNSMQPRALEEGEVGNVMSSLRSCKEQWVVVKLLRRMQDAEDERVLRRVVKFHGYEYLKTTLNTFKEDNDIVLQVLEILHKLPRLTRNKIDDSKIEPIIDSLTTSEHEDVAEESKKLLEVWKPLQVGYRIPRRVREAKVDKDTDKPVSSLFDDRRHLAREAAAAQAAKPPSPVRNAPTGPRNSAPLRNPHQNFVQRRRNPHKDNSPLPAGWLSAVDPTTGLQYYWDASNPDKKSWTRPTIETLKQSASAALQAQKIQDIINQCAQPTPKPASASHTPQPAGTPIPEPKKEKWRSWPVDKQRKLYENTIFPYVKHVADKFYKKLPKEDLKKFAKEINKTLAASDYKHNRVEDPSKISEKQQVKVKKYTKEFLEKAVKKHEQREQDRAARKAKQQQHQQQLHKNQQDNHQQASDGPPSSGPSMDTPMATAGAADSRPSLSVEASPMVEETIGLSPSSPIGSTGSTPDRKRKRDNGPDSTADGTPGDAPSLAKRLKEELNEAPSPPPPPTPPPLEELDDDAVMIDEAEAAAQLQEHEDALVRENEEAAAEQRKLREHEEALERENQEAMLAVREQNGGGGGAEDEDTPMVNGTVPATTVVTNRVAVINNGAKVLDPVAVMGTSLDDAAAAKLELESRKREVLGH